LAGAAAGLAVGGPIGALLGGVAGHYVVNRDEDDAPAENQVAFTVGVIALGAKMAKPTDLQWLGPMRCDMRHHAGCTQLCPQSTLGAYQNVVAATVRRFEGFIAEYHGDGVLIYFGSEPMSQAIRLAYIRLSTR